MKYCKHLRFINISVGALTLVVGLLLVGCNSSMTDDDRDKISTLNATEEIVESDELFWEDCEYYWNVLETFYPLCLYPAEDYDYTEIKQSMQTKVKGCGNIGEFVEMLKGISAFFNYSYHLNVVSKDQYKLISELYTNQICSLPPEVVAGLNNMSAKKFYSNYDVYSSKTSKAENISIDYYASMQMVIIKIKSFDYSNIEQDKNTVNQVLNQYEGIKYIVFDITGNRGGSTDYWLKNIVEPFGGCFDYTEMHIYNDNAVTRDNYPMLFEGGEIDIQIPGFSYAKGDTSNFDFGEEKYTDINRIVLADAECYSASDQFVHFCREQQWATVIGSRTGGSGLGIEPIWFCLPKTGVIISFCPVSGVNVDGTDNGRSGESPDFYVIKKESPRDALFRYLEEEKR